MLVCASIAREGRPRADGHVVVSCCVAIAIVAPQPSIFVWVLLGFSAVAMLAMPLLIGLLAGEFANVPGKFELAVSLSRITFPYLMLVSLVAMLSGLLIKIIRFLFFHFTSPPRWFI